MLSAFSTYQVKYREDEADQPEILKKTLESWWRGKSPELTRAWPIRDGLSHNLAGKGGVSQNNMT